MPVRCKAPDARPEASSVRSSFRRCRAVCLAGGALGKRKDGRMNRGVQRRDQQRRKTLEGLQLRQRETGNAEIGVRRQGDDQRERWSLSSVECSPSV